MDIYEDSRTVSRSDLAAWLRQLANQLESDGRLFYGAAGAVTVADTVRCELEIERESETEVSVEIEFSWTEPARVTVADEQEPAKDAEAAEPAETTPEPAS
ncbi:amphi-Trp domain-containing protein [Micromonospora sp. M51]|uniref:Amphi-Trp domain-containing protein n=1 Tax=Micromonospora parva TaxID=1464048 RepID=A0ABW6W2P3_9ACTN|nr:MULTISPECIES: amphi-Trp domain-containing protein [unclassified Micromonospora]MBQ1010343.1 amphi-Trp domain-containing protein [Micromonospora sp. M51]MBQ1030184.1 amphi-Trp domain-containing protein [Micromonospora sp. C97]